MEIFLLLLAVPVVWLMLLPVRAMGKVQQHPFRAAGILMILAFFGFVAFLGLRTDPKPTVVAEALPVIKPVAADYASGDTALRALLE
jgi:hypothetical protein